MHSQLNDIVTIDMDIDLISKKLVSKNNLKIIKFSNSLKTIKQ